MKWILIVVGVLVGIPALYFAVVYGASELGGEVVVLHRTNDDGTTSHVRIWIVEQDGQTWVEHGAPDAAWISQLADNPVLTVERDGQAREYRGSADAQAHTLYHQLRKEKYGFADSVVEMATADAASCTGVPVRLSALP